MTIRTRNIAIPLIAASALALSACGDSVSNSEPTDVDTAQTAAVADEPGTLVDVASANPDFSTLVTAVEAAKLPETLSGTGPFTVFAPTNAAFDKLPDGTVDRLLQPDSEAELAGILTYHVVAGSTDAATLTKMIADNGGSAELTTVNGGKLTATVDGDKVILTDAEGNTATVTATDVEASNGVIHVIDSVLMPGGE